MRRGGTQTLVVLDGPALAPVGVLLPLLVLRQGVERLHGAAAGHLGWCFVCVCVGGGGGGVD